MLFFLSLRSTTIEFTQRNAQNTTETNRSDSAVGTHVFPCKCVKRVHIWGLCIEIIFKMGKKDKRKNKGKGAEKTAAKTDKKLSQKQKKKLAASGEVYYV